MLIGGESSKRLDSNYPPELERSCDANIILSVQSGDARL